MSMGSCAKAPDGSDIICVTIGDDQLQATVTTFGACLKDLRFKKTLIIHWSLDLRR